MSYRARTARMYQIMKARGESTRSLARQVGCSHVTIWTLLADRKGCSEDLARRVAQALEVKQDDLFFTHPVKSHLTGDQVPGGTWTSTTSSPRSSPPPG